MTQITRPKHQVCDLAQALACHLPHQERTGKICWWPFARAFKPDTAKQAYRML